VADWSLLDVQRHIYCFVKRRLEETRGTWLTLNNRQFHRYARASGLQLPPHLLTRALRVTLEYYALRARTHVGAVRRHGRTYISGPVGGFRKILAEMRRDGIHIDAPCQEEY